MTFATLRAEDLGIVTLLKGFDMLTGRVLGTSHKQTVTTLLDGQWMATIRTGRPLEHFLYIAARGGEGKLLLAVERDGELAGSVGAFFSGDVYRLNASIAYEMPPAGHLGLFAQSGE